jgi:hypothetical protein
MVLRPFEQREHLLIDKAFGFRKLAGLQVIEGVVLSG